VRWSKEGAHSSGRSASSALVASAEINRRAMLFAFSAGARRGIVRGAELSGVQTFDDVESGGAAAAALAISKLRCTSRFVFLSAALATAVEAIESKASKAFVGMRPASASSDGGRVSVAESERVGDTERGNDELEGEPGRKEELFSGDSADGSGEEDEEECCLLRRIHSRCL